MNTTTLNIEELASWSDARRVSTKNGIRLLRTATPADFKAEIQPRLKEIVKSTGELSWSKDRNTGEWGVCWWAEDVAAKRAIEASKAADVQIEIPAPDGMTFYPFQKAGIAYAMQREATLIADEMGIGKTIQAVGVINGDSSIQDVLIICPPSLVLNWKREIERWMISEREVTIIGAKWPEYASGVVIIGDSRVSKHSDRLREREWDLVVIDECHRLKDPKALRSKAIFGFKTKAAISARRKICLTGTPIPNRPMEAQSFLGWLRPDLFGNRFYFGKKFANGHQKRFGWDFSGASNLSQLQDQLRANIMVRRLKKDVLAELPPKTRQVIELEGEGVSRVVAAERKAFEDRKETLEKLREAVETAKLLEDEDAYKAAIEALKKGTSVAFESMSEVRKAVAEAKVPYVVEHVLEAAGEHPVVLFAHHKDVVAAFEAAFAEAGIATVKVVGGMSAEAKQEAVDAFQSGAAQIFIGNIHAAGVGLTLTRSSHVVFAELDWVPANMTQAEDRCHRIGATSENVLIQHLVLAGSLDAHMARVLVEKQAIADKALDALTISEPISTGKNGTLPAITTKPERTYSEAEIAKLQSAIIRLASVCDGAKELDSHGFNKMDAHYGRLLASLAKWSQRQTAVAHKLCTKYRRQVGEVL